MKWTFATLLALTLSTAACTQRLTTTERFNRIYVGQNTDKFFLDNGPPISKFQLNNGDTIYRWSSRAHSVPLPAVTTTSGQVDPNGSFYATSQTEGGGFLHVQCVLQVVASPASVIKDVSIEADSLGLWHFSRCAELVR